MTDRRMYLIAGVVFLTRCNIGCLFVPCDLALDAVVTVHDASGAPLQGVAVDVLGRAGETSANGCAKLDGVIHSKTVCVRAERSGYKTYGECKSYDFYRITVTLERAASARTSSAVWKVRSDPNELLTCPER